MTSANLDLVRSILAGWERGDYGSTDWAHPEIEFVLADGPTPGRWIGVAEMAAGFRDWLSAWEDYRSEVDEYRVLDDERVLVLTHRSGRGKTSGVELGQIQSRGAGLFQIRDGKVVGVVGYLERDRALADLGLAREGGFQR